MWHGTQGYMRIFRFLPPDPRLTEALMHAHAPMRHMPSCPHDPCTPAQGNLRALNQSVSHQVGMLLSDPTKLVARSRLPLGEGRGGVRHLGDPGEIKASLSFCSVLSKRCFVL